MRSELPRLGHEVTVCPDGRAALKVLEKNTFDAAILDLRMPGMTGIEVLEHLKGVSPDTEAIVMTGHASTDTAIQAMRLGAFDYITKPCKLAEIEAVLSKVAEKRALEHKNLALQTRVRAAAVWGDLACCHAKAGRLAGTVGTEQADHLTGIDIEVYAVDDLAPAV